MEQRTFGKTVRLLRKERVLSQGELGELVGLSPSAIGSYERGFREPGFANLCDLANLFEVSVDYLIGNTDERQTVKAYMEQEKYELKEVLEKYTITLQNNVLSNEEKQHIYDVAVGLLYGMRLKEK